MSTAYQNDVTGEERPTASRYLGSPSYRAFTATPKKLFFIPLQGSLHKDFPGTSIIDQFFAERSFEACRKLGMDAMESRLKKDGSQGLDSVFGSHTRQSGASIGD